MKTIKTITLLLFVTTFFIACTKSEDPEPVNEEEVITTVTATLVPDGGGATITLTSKDLDGDGPNKPVITVSGNLAANKTYKGTLSLLNETENPAEDITTEIKEEDKDHQFFFSFTNSIATATYGDKDGNGNPVGLKFNLVTGNSGSGDFTIILRHEPNKLADGVKDGKIKNAGGETDIEVTFPITVK